MNSSLPLRHQLIKARWMKTLRRRDGSALLVVLAFVLLLTVITLAFLSRSLLEKKVSDASAYQTRTDVFASSAVGAIISDFQAEIAAGSNNFVNAATLTKFNSTIKGLGGSTEINFYNPVVNNSGTVPVPLTMVPSRTWTTTGTPASVPYPNLLPNLLKCSRTGVNGGAFFYPSNDGTDYPNAGTYPPTEMTFANQDTNDATSMPSLNGRAYTAQRWNQPLLLPKLNPGTTDTTPIASFVVPDWILVRRDGTNATIFSTSGSSSLLSAAPGVVSPTTANPVVGRYAYTVYDEGGVLDMNVAGYPVAGNAPTNVNYKSTLANADLTQLEMPDGTGFKPNGTQLLTQNVVNSIVGWRNNATLEASGTIPNYSFSQLANYFQNIQANTSGLLTGNTTLSSGTTGQSDRKFSSRQQLIDLLVNDIAQNSTDKANFQNALQFMGTFSRDLNQPSYQPDVNRPRMTQTLASAYPTSSGVNASYGDDASQLTSSPSDALKNGWINPAFLTTVATKAYTRDDGSTANIGDLLVKRRFALNRLAWITYLGPISAGTTYSTGCQAIATTFKTSASFTDAFLLQGTASNIQKYFGLEWLADKNDNGRMKWFYDVHNTSVVANAPSANGTTATGAKGSILELGGGITNNKKGLATSPYPHDPDFFELLKAAILAGSKGKSLTDMGADLAYLAPSPPDSTHPWYYQALEDESLDYQIIQLGANIIAQFQPAGYPPEVVFSDGSGSATDPLYVQGVENLPYFYRMRIGSILLRNASHPQIADVASKTQTTTNTASFKDTGVGLEMIVPEIWNPHDVNAPMGNPGPALCRLVVDSTYPSNIPNNTSFNGYEKIYAGGEDNVANGPVNNAVSITTKPPGTYQAAGPPNFCLDMAGGTQVTGGYQGNPQILTPANTALQFNVSAQSLYRDPTLLSQHNVPPNSNLALSNAPTGDYALVKNSSGTLACSQNGFIADGDSADPLGIGAQAGIPYLGIPLGLYPIEFPVNTYIYDSVLGGVYEQGAASNLTGAPYLTFRMQYQDPSGKWVTYDTKYVNPNILFLGGNPPVMLDENSTYADGQSGGWISFFDPRTSRFGTPASQSFGGAFYSAPFTFVEKNNDVLASDRPDYNAGYDHWINHAGGVTWITDIAPGWTASTFTPNPVTAPSLKSNWGDLRPGPYSQNTFTTTSGNNGFRYANDPSNGNFAAENSCYADPDGVVRRAMGGYQPELNTAPGVTPSGLSAPTTGLPMAIADLSASPAPTNITNQHESRPYFLHRPFRSVAELGYVFSGTPWKNIDFFNDESGDSALLDVFCISDTDNPNGLVAGKVSLNTQQAPVLWSILNGAYKDDQNPTGSNIGSEAIDLAQALINRTAYVKGVKPTYIMTNVKDLVGRWNQTKAATPNGSTSVAFFDGQFASSKGSYFDGFSNDLSLYDPALSTVPADKDQYTAYIQRFREAAIRALSAVGQTRVWNVMIDVVAQTGRFPSTAANASNFLVEGERRYWVHVAIDRYTGQVLDQQIEEVKQ